MADSSMLKDYPMTRRGYDDMNDVDEYEYDEEEYKPKRKRRKIYAKGAVPHGAYTKQGKYRRKLKEVFD